MYRFKITGTIKAQLIHKQIMLIIASEIVQKVGEMKAGWSRESHNHVCYTADVIETKRKTLQRQFWKYNVGFTYIYFTKQTFNGGRVERCIKTHPQVSN